MKNENERLFLRKYLNETWVSGFKNQSFLPKCGCNMDANCYIFRLCDDIELMIGSRPGYFWLLCWRFIGPLAMVVIFVASLIEIFSKGVSYEVWNSLKVCDRQFIFGTVHLVIRN